MKLPDSEKLEIQYLSHLFDKKSECYKLFWFEAILNKTIEGKIKLTYDELINEMIASAWYMVTEYHLNLGPADTLESLVCDIYKISGLRTTEKKENILAFLESCQDKTVRTKKRTLTYHVPYRLQAPFMEHMKGKEWNVSEKALAEKINGESRLMYYFTSISGMFSSIEVQPQWRSYLIANQNIIKGWIEYHKIIYLQRRNPGVPGIACKLYPEKARDLERVRKYWKAVLAVQPMPEIYGNNQMTGEDMAIDHFIPWSYVAHDELWNLSPTTKQINSSKHDRLPDWETYFPALCSMEYAAYERIWQYEHVKDAFHKCLDHNVNDEAVKKRLYRPGIEREEFYRGLEEVLYPVYQSAGRQGFHGWSLDK